MLPSRVFTATRYCQMRLLHSSPSLFATATKGQAPAASRRPVENTHGEQNSHLKHSLPGDGDNGKGNSGQFPKLPSRELDKRAEHGRDASNLSRRSESSSQQNTMKRGLHTSARVQTDSDAKGKHSADSYFKEVDTSPPPNAKTHHVDSGNAKIQRPYENVSQETPYEPPVENKKQEEERLTYAGGKTSKSETPRTVSGGDEGPEGKGAGGRGPSKST